MNCVIAMEEVCLGGAIVAEARWVGKDLWVLVAGGDLPHVGSVSVGVPRDSLTGDGTRSATVSTFNVTGHMDDGVGDRFAKRLAAVFGCQTSVTCGIHFDAAKPDDIKTILACAERLLARVEGELGKAAAEK